MYSGHVFGVSPAYFISKFGQDFSPDEVISGLQGISEAGFQSAQVEFVSAESLDAWTDKKIAMLREASADSKIIIDHFVAHYLMEYSSFAKGFTDERATEQFRRTLHVVGQSHLSNRIIIPIAPYIEEDREIGASNLGETGHREAELDSRLLRLINAAARQGIFADIEVHPASLFGSLKQLSEFLREHRTLGAGYNFDTGHAHAMHESVGTIPSLFSTFTRGTHLCDNFGRENLSMRPGTGSIDWPNVLQELVRNGYGDAFTIEISCASNVVEAEYRSALHYLSATLDRISAASRNRGQRGHDDEKS